MTAAFMFQSRQVLEMLWCLKGLKDGMINQMDSFIATGQGGPLGGIIPAHQREAGQTMNTCFVRHNCADKDLCRCLSIQVGSMGTTGNLLLLPPGL